MNTKELKLSITGMTCNHCVSTVEKAVKAVYGVQSVKVSLENQSGLIVYDIERTSPGILVSTVNQANYKAEIV